MEKSPYDIKPFTVFDESATDRSSNKDNKDQFEYSINDFNVLNKIASYSWILDIRVCVIYIHHTFRYANT